jgi:hypothetical protein
MESGERLQVELSVPVEQLPCDSGQRPKRLHEITVGGTLNVRKLLALLQRGNGSVWQPDWIGLVAVPISLAITAAVDAMQLPWRNLSHSFNIALCLPLTTALLVLELPTRFPSLVVLQLVAGLVIACAPRISSRLCACLAFLTSAALGLTAYSTLVEYERFEGYPPFILAEVSCVVIWGLSLGLRASHRRARILRAAVGVLSATIAVAAYLAHTRTFLGYYPSLHLALLQVGAISTQAALIAFTGSPAQSPGSRAARRVLVTVALLVSITTVGLPATAALPPSFPPYVRSSGSLGNPKGSAFLALDNIAPRKQEDLPRCSAQRTALVPEDAVAIFEAHAGLPQLPPAFALQRHNVLVVVIESLRLDEIGLETTPNLLRLRDMGAYFFAGARTPATCTLQALSGILALRLPIDTPVAFGAQNWIGELDATVSTAAEAALRAGYRTFHVLHGGVLRCCGESLSRGFEIRAFQGDDVMDEGFAGLKQKRTVDKQITEWTIQLLGQLTGDDHRYFGLIFYFGPHSPWLARRPGKWSAQERYRQEIHNSDLEFGRLLAYLQDRHQLDDTVLAVMADHGEQFGDHGGYKHGNSVYAELKRVPLLIWLPGIPGHVVDKPTSTGYVLPWLFLRGPEPMRDLANRGLASSIAPVMRMTQGAVPVDLVWAWGKLGSIALEYPTASIQYEYGSGLTKLFDLAADPREQHNVYETGLPDKMRLVKLLEQYTQYRRCSP